MTTRNLWSWLVRSDAKTEVYVPPDLNLLVSNSEFGEALKAQAAANHLPVEIQLQDVEWDGSGSQKPRILVRHADPRMNIVQFLTGLDRFGDFYYVEEKLYWDPPELPEPPSQRRTAAPTQSSTWIWLVLTGALAIIAGLASAGSSGECAGVGFLVGLVIGLIGFAMRNTAVSTYETERQQYEATQDFDEAVDEWISQTKDADYKSRTDDEFGRFYLAMRSTIRQTIQKLFVDRHAELRERREKETTQQELAAELERRKGEGFK